MTVFAGPNGSGKSSLIERIDFEGKQNLLSPDAIARRVVPRFPKRAAIQTAREVIRRTSEYLRLGESFAIETTLAGSWTTNPMKLARQLGFLVRLVYVCVDSSERCIERVRERVAQGGHDVPDQDIRRRYTRSLSRAAQVLRIADDALVFDNSGSEPRVVFEMRSGTVLTTASKIPAWAEVLLDQPHE